jgi:hypothetical protein
LIKKRIPLTPIYNRVSNSLASETLNNTTPIANRG